jgi:hypothetical protein
VVVVVAVMMVMMIHGVYDCFPSNSKIVSVNFILFHAVCPHQLNGTVKKLKNKSIIIIL